VDAEGFLAPFVPTTAEQRHPGFRVAYEGHECQWNGPSWPYATSAALTALANFLQGETHGVIDRGDYFETLLGYARSHRLRSGAAWLEVLDGQRRQVGPSEQEVPDANGEGPSWIDEVLNPYTGDWIARTRLERMQYKTGQFRERGKDYNHSSFCDLIISGLVGLRPEQRSSIAVHPLVPEGAWDWFCLDDVAYRHHSLSIVWDRSGHHFGRGAGLRIWLDGREVGGRSDLGPIEIPEEAS
jgi:hypothetical protein